MRIINPSKVIIPEDFSPRWFNLGGLIIMDIHLRCCIISKQTVEISILTKSDGIPIASDSSKRRQLSADFLSIFAPTLLSSINVFRSHFFWRRLMTYLLFAVDGTDGGFFPGQKRVIPRLSIILRKHIPVVFPGCNGLSHGRREFGEKKTNKEI